MTLLKDAQGIKGRRGQASQKPEAFQREDSIGGNFLTRRDYFQREGSKNRVVEKPCDTHSMTNYGLGLGVPARPLMCSVTCASHLPFLALGSPYVN